MERNDANRAEAPSPGARAAGGPLGPWASTRRLRYVGVLGLVAAAATATQALYVGVTGEEICVGQGCSLVAGLSRLSPALFNLFGTAVFAAIAALAFLTGRPGLRRGQVLLYALLTAALAAEGVLFAYQWHVAGAWCVYCLGILAAVAALNLLFSARGSLLGFSSFAASLTIFSLLSFVPFQKTLDDGTAAVRTARGSPEMYLLFSENCSHCRRVIEALGEWERCTVRLNPVSRIPDSLLPPDLERRTGYDPVINSAAAGLLGIRTVPILVAKESGTLRVVTGEQAILRYAAQACSPRKAAPSLLEPRSDLLLSPGDDGCGIKTDCD